MNTNVVVIGGQPYIRKLFACRVLPSCAEPVKQQMEDCGFLLLDDDFLDLTSAEFFRILADEDLSGDLPELPDTSESEFASEHCVDQMMDSQQRSSSEAGTIVASCFSMSLPQQTVVDVDHLTLPRHQQWQPSRASSSSCSDDCTPPQPCHVIDTVLPATSAPCSPLSTAGQVPCSSTGSMLPDLTCCAVHHCSTSSAGTLHEVAATAAAAAVPAAAHQAVDNKQQQQGQALSKQKIAASKRKAPEVSALRPVANTLVSQPYCGEQVVIVLPGHLKALQVEGCCLVLFASDSVQLFLPWLL